MTRPLRIEYAGAWHHVMNRCRRGEVIFKDKGDHYFFIELLKETGVVFKSRISAYCLMTNHYHLLIQTPEGNLSRCMRHINGVYTQYYNRRYHSEGQLFRGRYKSILIDSENYLLELVRYIHRNPLEAGIAADLKSYVWSSHNGYLSSDKAWGWLYKEIVLKMFSANYAVSQKKYMEFVLKETSEEINSIFNRKKWPSIIGSDKFIEGVKERFFNKKRHMEVPDSKALAPEIEKIKEALCRLYEIKEGELLYSKRGERNEARNIAMYLTRQLRGSKHTEIGREFKVSNYSTVSTIIERMKERIQKERRIRKRVDELKDELIVSQEQT